MNINPDADFGRQFLRHRHNDLSAGEGRHSLKPAPLQTVAGGYGVLRQRTRGLRRADVAVKALVVRGLFR